MSGTLSCCCAAPSSPRLVTTVQVLRRRLRQRFGVELQEGASESAAQLVLALQPDAGRAEGFCLDQPQAGQVRITGYDDSGLLYGVGQYLHTCDHGPEGFVPSPWRGQSVPRRPVRGMYFATHFHNFYHEAPLERVHEYIEDLALWGCNALSVWFDYHHYTGIGQPEAQAMLTRLRSLLRHAGSVGMHAGLTSLANEAYADSPVALRADPETNRAHYRVELCPSIPAGRALILQWRPEMLAAFADLDVRYVWLWPYDQGGCACAGCAPWGANGFLRLGRDVAAQVRRFFPQARVVLSTWLFDFTPAGPGDQGEWRGLAEAFGREAPWADYLMADSHWETFPRYPLEHGVPGNLPMLSFPEISMFTGGPWGGWGAIPAPERFQHLWDQVGARLAGGFPYSEGIYEDINKVICLRHQWADEPADRSLRAYATAYWGAAAAEDAARAMAGMEQTAGNHLPTPPPTDVTVPLYRRHRVGDVDAVVRHLDRAEAWLDPPARQGWRWRLLRLRGELDRQIEATGGRPSDGTDGLFAELEEIYAARQAEFWVAPPTRARLRQHGYRVDPT